MLDRRCATPGTQTAPNVAVTVDSFNYSSDFPDSPTRKRPIWVIEQGPGRGRPSRRSRAGVSPPGGGADGVREHVGARPARPRARRARSCWHVVPVKPGLHGVHYAIAAGLAGKAKAVLALRAAPSTGAFTVDIAPAPPADARGPEHRPGRPRRYSVADDPPSGRRGGPFGPLSKDRPPISPAGDPFARGLALRLAGSGHARPGAAPPATLLQEESSQPMSRTRQQNVTAAQWSANGSALGSPDLTLADNQVFGANVFSPGRPAPAPAQARLQGPASDARPRRGARHDARRRRRPGDEGMGDGEGRDPLHALVPAADGLDRREARLLLRARPATARRSPSSPARS